MPCVVKQKIQTFERLDYRWQRFLSQSEFTGYLVAIPTLKRFGRYRKLGLRGFKCRQMSVLASSLKHFKNEQGRHSISRSQFQAMPGLGEANNCTQDSTLCSKRRRYFEMRPNVTRPPVVFDRF